MKAYLITTGSLFAVLAVAHAWRVIAEWPALLTKPLPALEAAIGLVAAALSVWAFRLLRTAK